MTRTRKYPEQIRKEAVRLVRAHRDEYDSEWAAISSVAGKFGAVPQTVHSWVRRADVDDGVVDGLSSDERQKIKDLQRENRELRRANEILKAASVFFAAELDPRPKSWAPSSTGTATARRLRG
jgi:transposase-like protein